MYKVSFCQLAIVAFTVLLVACKSTGIVPMDSETYMIAKKSSEFGFGPPIKAKADVYNEANEYCAKEQKTVETIDFEMRNAVFGRQGSVSLEFRCE